VCISRPVALDSVFQALDSNDVCWCLLRPEPSHEKGDDVDLLVAASDLRRVHQLLNAVGFARIPAWGHASHVFFVGYDAPSDRWVHLDIVSELAFGPSFTVKTAAAGHCLRRRERTEGAWTLHPDDGFWTLLLHNLLDKQALQAKHRDRLRSLAGSASTDNPLARELDGFAAPESRAARLLDCARAGDWQQLEVFAAGLVSTWIGRHRLKAASAFVEMRLARKMSHLFSPLLRHGFSVALIGLDTADKTTIATSLEASLPVPVRRTDLRVVGWIYQSAGRIVILDRFAVRPKPDLTLLFDSPPEPLHERRTEEARTRGLRRSAVVDASRDPNVVRRDVLALIWSAYCRDQRGSPAS